MVRNFVLLFILLVLLPFLVLGFYLQAVYSSRSRVEIARNLSLTYQQQVDLLEEELREKSFLITSLGYDVDFMEHLDSYHRAADPREILQIQREISSRLQAYIGYKEEIEVLAFYFSQEGVYYQEGAMIDDFNSPFVNETAIRSLPGYREALKKRGTVLVRDAFSSLRKERQSSPHISLFFAPTAGGASRIVEMIHLSFKLPAFLATEDGEASAVSEEMYVIDREGGLIYSSPDQEDNQLPAFDELSQFREVQQFSLKRGKVKLMSRGGQEFLLVEFLIPKTGWNIYRLIDLSLLNRELNVQLTVIRFSFLFTTLLFLVFIIYQYRYMVRPVEHLAGSMVRAGEGDFKATLTPSGPPELRRLFAIYSQMMSQINELTEEKIRAEIAALQFQINPHFLSNTLNTIRLMAMLDKNKNTTAMIEALMKITAHSLDSDGKYTTLAKQIENVNSYIYIMNVRYGNVIRMDCQIPEELKDLFVLKMLLQPVIENAVLHGLREKEGEKVIKVTAYKEEVHSDEELRIIIEDNGSGFPREEFERILSGNEGEDEVRKGIGLVNVISRIRVNYGTTYGLEMESKDSEFTRIIFYLPLLEEAPGV